MFKPHTAMIFAAGLGTRMKPLTDHTPKPMVKVSGVPMIDYRLQKLLEAGVKRIVINTFYLPEQIEKYVRAHYKDCGMEIIFSREAVRLETGGGLVFARQHLGDDPIYLVNSDVIWRDVPNQPTALELLAQDWDDARMDVRMLLCACDKAIGYHGKGDFVLTETGALHKPTQESYPFVFTGIQMLHPRVIDALPHAKPGAVFSLSEVYRQANKNGVLQRINGVAYTGDWLHIDSPETLLEAEEYLASAVV